VKPSQEYRDFPLITVCMLTLNRAWIIDLVLISLLNQDYPKERIRFILVDGGSTDGTLMIAERILRDSGIQYEIIAKKSNIGEARNICIDKMQGDLLVFWDSDIIAPPNALRKLIEYMGRFRLDILAARRTYVSLNNIQEARYFASKLLEDLNRDLKNIDENLQTLIERVHFVGMDLTVIKRDVVRDVRFKPMSFSEDAEFCLHALKKGYNIAISNYVRVYDVKARKVRFSDPFIYSPIRDTLRFLNTLAYLETVRRGHEGRFLREVCSLSDIIIFYIKNKHYIVKIGFFIILALFLSGLVLGNKLLILLLPLLWTLYLVVWITKLGIHGGLRRALGVFIVGMPLALTVTYHLLSSYLKCRCRLLGCR